VQEAAPRRLDGEPPRRGDASVQHVELHAAIALATLGRVVACDGPLLAVAARDEAAAVDALRDEELERGIGRSCENR